MTPRDRFATLSYAFLRRNDTIRNVSSTRQMVCGGMNEACNIGKLDTSRRARTGFWGMCVRRSGGWEVDTWDWEGNNRL